MSSFGFVSAPDNTDAVVDREEPSMLLRRQHPSRKALAVARRRRQITSRRTPSTNGLGSGWQIGSAGASHATGCVLTDSLQEFFTSLLSSAVTKRDAKAYISRLKSPVKVTAVTGPPHTNVSSLFSRTRAVDESPVFTQYDGGQEQSHEGQERLHVALVKISNVGAIADGVLNGVAQTLSQLARLSMVPCVVIDETSDNGPWTNWREKVNRQADRLVSAIDAVSQASGGRRVDHLLGLGHDGRPQVLFAKLLLHPLRRGCIPVIVPTAYSDRSQSVVQITADEVMLALTRELAGLNFQPGPGEDAKRAAEQVQQAMQKQISLDRIIVVDDTGAIPSTKSLDKKHLFINLEQEYSALQEELRSSSDGNVSHRHASNLKLLREALYILPPASSGLITTPVGAANPGPADHDPQVSSVGTRRQKNPLIHNLLTDKPAYSSSLPSGRLARDRQSPLPLVTSTFVKRGTPCTILPDPAAQPWTADSQPRLKLTDSQIDLGRLTYLINDSFNRQLDVEAYLQRVNEKIAGVIVVGDYEGGAILTWETPPGAADDDPSRLVPYLDKFAVLKRSQGAGGVADIVFNAMVRTCFPKGVCWRSRKDNPVNKWYFERSRGTWKIPGTNWAMFWTTPTAVENSQTFLDYEGVCRGVQPTWADHKKVQD